MGTLVGLTRMIWTSGGGDGGGFFFSQPENESAMAHSAVPAKANRSAQNVNAVTLLLPAII
jgi:hypothetical protein